MPRRAATPPNEAPYPTLVGTATSGTPVRPPTTDGRAPSMPATTTRQSATASRSRTASSRCRPATPTSSIRSTAAPCTRTVSAASAATGASEVPALTIATVPRGSGSGPSVTARATRSVAASGSARATTSRASGIEAGGQDGAVGVPLVQGAQDRDHLVGRLAGAVDDLGITGPGGAVEVDAGEAEVTHTGVGLVHAENLPGATRATRPGALRPSAARCWLKATDRRPTQRGSDRCRSSSPMPRGRPTGSR